MTSLTLYLVHIGVVDTIFALDYSINIKTTIFVVVIVVGVIISCVMAEKCNKFVEKIMLE